MIATSANAAYYNFLAEGNTKEAGYSTFNTGTDSASTMQSGLTITASLNDGTTAANAYMDSGGGLGVCKELDTFDQCDPRNDDNQQSSDEYIHMVFDDATEILGLTIQGDHQAVVGDGTNTHTYLNYSLDGVVQTAIEISGANLTFIALAANAGVTTLDYYITSNLNQAQIYVTSLTTVPVPAAIWLFGTAILGLVGFNRRKSATGTTIAA